MKENSIKRAPAKVLIVDDHPVICHGLKRVLAKQDDIIIVGEANDCDSAIKAIAQCQPEVVVVDITLRGVDGISLVNRIKGGSVKVIMYTMHSSKEYIARAFQAGALGYVLKSDKTEQLIQAIREVLAGKVYLSESLSTTVIADLVGRGDSAQGIGTQSLTPREYEVASLIAQGLTLDKIGETLFISPQTVRVHRTRIMHKLACSGVHELLLTLRHHFPQLE